MKRSKDFIGQKQTIEDMLDDFKNLLSSPLDFYPADVQKMLRHIHNHLFENSLTVKKVKKACRLTNNNVTTKFRHSVGVAPHEYIVTQRLEAAAVILYQKDIDVYLLADAVGYT